MGLLKANIIGLSLNDAMARKIGGVKAPEAAEAPMIDKKFPRGFKIAYKKKTYQS